MRARRNACELEQRAVRFSHLLLALEAEHAHVSQALPPFFFSMYMYLGQAYGGIGGCYTSGGTEGVCGAARVWHACSATGSGTAAATFAGWVYGREEGGAVWIVCASLCIAETRSLADSGCGGGGGGVLTLMLIKA